MEFVRSNRIRVVALLMVLVGILAGMVWGAEAIGLVDTRKVMRLVLGRVPGFGNQFQPPSAVTGSDFARADALAYERAAVERARTLDEREEELRKEEEEIRAGRDRLARDTEDLAVREESLRRAQGAFDARETEVARLVTLYTGMRPQEAARVFERTDDLLVIEIIRRMPSTNASAILRVMDPDIAARITRQMGLEGR